MIIITLPPVHYDALTDRIIEHPLVDGVRYNVANPLTRSPMEILSSLKRKTERKGKRFIVDITGRQLRIKRWADCNYGEVRLNHKIKVDLPATIVFRNGDIATIKGYKDNQIVFEPEPTIVGEGQSVNIHGHNLVIDRYLTQRDIVFLECCRKLGIEYIGMSFTQNENDTHQVLKHVPQAKLILKIEDSIGLSFIETMPQEILNNAILMAARDDLLTNIGPWRMLSALQMIIHRDPNAICASQIFLGLETGGRITAADVSDVIMMKQLGFKHFMLSDGLSKKHFNEAIDAWRLIQPILRKGEVIHA